jgi:DNA-binding transcriptional ArsR family regulator
MNDLVWALRRHFDLALAPHWAQIRDELAADHASRTRQATRGGLERMLGGFGPSVRWRWPYLEADYPREHRIDLAGRGLTLIPSYFCTGTVVTLIDPELRPVLVYPAIRQVADPAALDRALWRLTGVLSRTRASILVALRVPLSTSDLASTIGMSLASASQQVTLLRKAGLVTSTRHGQAVIHALTPLGKALLEAR